MIFTDRKITVRNGKSTINEPVILYRGDYEVSIKFTIMESKFRFKSGVNLVDSEKASHGQLAILAPYGGNVFSEIVKCEDGTVTFTLTKEMIDQLEEVGLYSFQIRLFDYYRESRVSIPPVEFGIEVREPVASEDHDNTVNNAIVGYSIAKVVDPKEENVGSTFDDNGQYNKTDWETGDRITEGKLNKIEDAIDTINQNEIIDKNALNKQMTSNFNVLQNQIDAMDETKANEIDLDVERKRINQLTKLGEGSTTGDAELVDLRVGVDGIIYSNAGSAVRSQINFLMDKKADSIDVERITGKDARIIEPSALVLNNGIIAYGSWSGVNDTGSNKHAVINVTPGYNYTLIGGNGSSSYCFLTSYDIPTSNTSPISYAHGYTSSVNLSVDRTVNITAPNNARFLYITMKANGTDRTPSLIQEDSLPNRLENIENNIDELNYISKDVYGKLDEIDLSTLKKYSNFIANGIWKSNSSFTCVMLPVDGNEKILMRGTGVEGSYTNYAFLTSDEIKVESKAYLCDGEDGTRTLYHDEEISIETPGDCKYLYILLINSNTDRTPSLVRYNHLGIKGKIDILNNDVNELKNDIHAHVDKESMEQMSTMMMALGSDFFNRKAIPIKIPQSYDTAKYNAWPFIHELNGRLICIYTRALAHEGSDIRSIYCKHSFDGIVWSKEIEILTNVKAYGAVTAIGKDNDGNLLFWLRNGGIGNSIKHELYKTTDGYEFSKIAEVSSPSDYTIEGLTSIINVPGVGLMSFFCTYLTGVTNVWGTVISSDNGLTWTQHPVETNLSNYDCPTEINAVYIGNGKIIGIGRRESTDGGENVLHQMESSDYGATWTRSNTNIDDITSSTSTLMYDETSGTISEFYIKRGVNTLKLRECNINDIWNNPKNWPDSIDIHSFNANGDGGHDGGQANGVYFNGTRIVAEYAGVPGMTSIYVTLIP